MRDRPRREVMPLEGRARKADDGRLEAAVIVGRPVEGAAKQLARNAAKFP